jgi:hypothetical protein
MFWIGGANREAQFTDLWELNIQMKDGERSIDWTKKELKLPENGFQARNAHSAQYNKEKNSLVIFGG